MDREDQKGWESFQRMTESKRRKLGRDSRLYVAIPDQPFESKRRLGLGVLNLKSRSAWRPPTQQHSHPPPLSISYRGYYTHCKNKTEIAKDHSGHHYRQLSRFMSKSKPSFHTTSRGPVTAASTFRLKYLVSGGARTMKVVHLT